MSLPRTFTTSEQRPSGRGLRRACLAAALAVGFAAPLAFAQPRLENIEQCIESSSDVLSLPAAASGTLTAKACLACDSQRLDFTPATRYFIGDTPVSYARLRTVAGARPMSVYVFYKTGTRTLTRLRLDAGADGASQ